VYLQDERLTTFAAASGMRNEGQNERAIKHRVDSEAAAIILRDFITSNSDSTGVNQS
jgi:RNase H-fold protein (predicted Holliday junction resolvase)